MADINLDDLLQKKNAAPQVAPQEEVAQISHELDRISPEDRKKIDAIKENLDMTDTQMTLQFGNQAQKHIADFSNSILSNVKGKELEEVGQLLSSLTTKVQDFEDEDSFLSKVPLVSTLLNKKRDLQHSYQALSVQIDDIQASLDNQKLTLMKDIVMFDGLYEQNLQYFKDLQLYIQAGEEKIEEMERVTLPKLRQQAAESDNPMAEQVVKDFAETITRFEKKIHDLKISKVIAIQTAPQIRIIQNSDKVLVERIQDAIYNTIPLWKNQMVIALGLNRQQKALDMERSVRDATNRLLEKNAEMLHQNAIDTAKENERAIVDVETVKKVNERLIATLDETLRIQQEGRQKRRAAEQELVQIEGQLKEAVRRSAGR